MNRPAAYLAINDATPTEATALGSAQALDSALPEWVQLVPAGAFNGVDGRGPWLVENAGKVIADSLPANGRPLVIDYDHATDLAASAGRPAPAAGWIVEMAARENGLWGRVEWTEAGAAAVKGREYRFLSPVFTHDKMGKVIRMMRAALTNNPNLELTSLNHLQSGDIIMDETLKALLAVLGLPADTDREKAINAVKSLAAADTDKASRLTALAAKAGLKPDAAADELVTALQSNAAVDPARYVPIAALTELQGKVSTLEKAQTGAAVETAVNAAIEDGKVSPAMKEWATNYATQDLAGFKAYCASAPAIVVPGAKLDRAPVDKDGALSADAKAVCAAMGLTEEEFKAAGAAGGKS